MTKKLMPLNEKELLDWIYDNRREFGSYPIICNEQFFKNLCKTFGRPSSGAGLTVDSIHEAICEFGNKNPNLSLLYGGSKLLAGHIHAKLNLCGKPRPKEDS